MPEKTKKQQREKADAEEAREEEEVSRRTSPSGQVVYKAVLAEADEELNRATSALFWSGIAAGLAMGLSMAAEGLIRHDLPQTSWMPLVSKLGYGFGFVVVILGRQQLFTENTLTPILPLLKRKDLSTLLNVARLWIVVLIANMVGALAISLISMRTEAFEAGVKEEFIKMGREAMAYGFFALVVRAFFAGWLIAMLVWMLPYAESAHFFVIMMVTWLIGIGHFAHIIAGAVEVFANGWAGDTGWGTIIGHYIVPVLIGNIIGGVGLVAALNHAQINSGEED